MTRLKKLYSGFLLLYILVSANALAQSTEKSYGLPAAATDISKIPPLVSKDVSVFLQEGGNIPSEAKFTCDDQAEGSFKSSAGYSLTHYFDGGKETLKQTLQAYKMIGGFSNEVKQDYERVNEQGMPGFISKSAITTEGSTIVYYTVKTGCIQDKNETATRVYYFVRVSDDSNFGTIQIVLYDGSAEKAARYAAEMMKKLKSLDFSSIQ
jgi:hypothetical protein